ncbi:MAG: beta-ketoacyl synthase N-terminal-like domain-containing protein [Pseudomonadales bacterium]
MTIETTFANNSVVITGMGVVCALGDTVDQFAAALKAGHSGIRALDKGDLPIQIGALISDFDFETSINALALSPTLIDRGQVAARRSSLVVQTAVCSALQAWCQADLQNSNIDATRVGLIIAGQNLNSGYSYAHYQRYQADLDYLPASYGLHFLDTNLVGTLSEILQIQGPGFTIGGASASGNVGIIQGRQLIQSGLVDICLVVGALADLSPLELQAWQQMGAMGGLSFSAEQSCRPFDQAHEGFIYGQGCGCLILESANHSQQRHTYSLASIPGTALTLDGNRLANPNPLGEARAMQQALQMAGLTAADINYINTHGSASALGDETEMTAIKSVCKTHISHIWLNATKGLTGHCLYAAGVIEAIATVIQMQQGFVHANKNLDKPIDNEARFVGDVAETTDIQTALSNSFGFGGINSAIVLTKQGNGII